jgi:AAA family ATP:ADP antiporter
MAREPGERRRLTLSFVYFALLLASYYLIRPVRDALAAGSGAASIKYLATAVFVVMLAIVPVFGALVARVRRSRLLPLTYAFFAANLLGFAVLFRLDPEAVWAGRVFYVWTTVFNLFVVSVFWSFMADIWNEQEGRRLFGVIAAGGSLGGIVGPLAARTLAGSVGISGLTLIAALLLALTIVAIVLLAREPRAAAAGGSAAPRLDEPVGGAILAGLSRLATSPFLLGIAALVALGSLLGMIVYIEMAKAAAAAFATAAERTAYYSQRDLWVNGGSFALQLLAVGPLARRLGVRPLLTGAATLAVAAFAGLAAAPALGMLLAVNVTLRTTEFGIGKPSRDMLYTVVDAETKYKVKNVVDTVVYRGSDVLSGWIHAGLGMLGLSLAGIAGCGAAIAALLAATAWAVGTGYRRRGGV